MSNTTSFQFKNLLIALSASAVLLTSTLSFAHSHDKAGQQGASKAHHSQDKGHDLKRMAKYLKLSDEQREAMRKIFATAKETREANKEAYKAAKMQFHQEMKAILSAEEFDENAVINLLQQNQSNVIQAEVAKAKIKHATLKVLTDEQKAKWEKFKKKAKKHAKR